VRGRRGEREWRGGWRSCLSLGAYL